MPDASEHRLSLPAWCPPYPTLVRHTAWSVLGIVLFLLNTHPLRAQVKLDRIYPPVVAIGSQSELQAEGKFGTWPVSVYCDRHDVQVTALEKSGQLSIQVPPQAAPGMVWLRLYDASSASTLVPLWLQPGAVGLETEANDGLPETLTTIPQTVVGRLEKNDDVDGFRVQLKANATFVASVTAHQHLRSPMDAVLQLVDLRGNVLAQSDDERGLDPQVVYQSEVDQELIVRLFAFPETPNSTIGFAGGATFVYVLQLTDQAYLDHVLPLTSVSAEAASLDALRVGRPYGWNLADNTELQLQPATAVGPPTAYLQSALGWQWLRDERRQGSDQTPATAYFEGDTGEPVQISSLPATFSGHISQADETDTAQFPVEEGRTYRAEVAARNFGFPLDSELRIVDPASGDEVARSDDKSRDDYDAAVEFKAKTSGQLALQLVDIANSGSPRHAYTLHLAEVAPLLEITLAADNFSLASGASLEIPLSLRRERFDQRLQLSASGLPAGVTSSVVLSEPKGDTAKAVKLQLTATADAAAFQGPFHIVAQPIDADGKPLTSATSYRATHNLQPHIQLNEFWLSVPPASK